ncbi:hypothetical protein MICAD_2990046 [Microcystis aeruginosa PCC 7941]|nr:hypothetical protein MICAD_2990046 [Microcystis aeruginosa PCC 7941]
MSRIDNLLALSRDFYAEKIPMVATTDDFICNQLRSDLNFWENFRPIPRD